jgi:hypothetical protein
VCVLLLLLLSSPLYTVCYTTETNYSAGVYITTILWSESTGHLILFHNDKYDLLSTLLTFHRVICLYL